MEGGRHARLAGQVAGMLCLVLGSFCYLYVVVHYWHVLSLVVIAALWVVALAAPAVCYGYRGLDSAVLMQVSDSARTAEDVQSLRETGYVTSAVAVACTFAPPFAWWYWSGGSSPPAPGVAVLFTANLLWGEAGIAWARLRIRDHMW